MDWPLRFFIWGLLLYQMLAYLYMMLKGGKMTDRQYLFFLLGMFAGTSGAAIESFFQGAWGTACAQLYFFSANFVGLYQRFKKPPPA